MGTSSDQGRFEIPWLRRPAVAPERPQIWRCANCAEPLNGPDATPRGPDTAWFIQCLACHKLAQERLELVEDQPGGARIQVYQCLVCSDQRSCRPGWTTRCHVCLDERSDAAWIEAASKECLSEFAKDPTQGLRVGRNLDLQPDEPITARAIVQAMSTLTIATALARFERPGWAIIASDVCGLPWRGLRSRSLSHGTWGRHETCGAIALMRAGTVTAATAVPGTTGIGTACRRTRTAVSNQGMSSRADSGRAQRAPVEARRLSVARM
jgi:hypothetical protein